MDLDTTPRTCRGVAQYADFWWLNAMTIIFAVLSFLLDLNQILESLSIIRKLRHRFSQSEQEAQPTEEEPDTKEAIQDPKSNQKEENEGTRYNINTSVAYDDDSLRMSENLA